MEVLAIILAPSGGPAASHHNIRSIGGKPMIAWSIEQALRANTITRVIVATDNEQYAAISRSHGAQTPFLLPAELASEATADLPCFTYILQELAQRENYTPDIVVNLRPTHPVRERDIIDQVVQTLVTQTAFDSVRTVAPTPQSPFTMWFRNDAGELAPVTTATDVPEPWDAAGTSLPATLVQTGNVDAVRTEVILQKQSMAGGRVFGFVEKTFVNGQDEDALSHLAALNASANEGRKNDEPKIFCFDIDGVVATITADMRYDQAQPITAMVEKINQLYDLGHRIILFTARGTMTGINWYDTTQHQMDSWGVKYHELKLGKPAATYYVDDRMLSFADLDRFIENQKPAKP